MEEEKANRLKQIENVSQALKLLAEEVDDRIATLFERNLSPENLRKILGDILIQTDQTLSSDLCKTMSDILAFELSEKALVSPIELEDEALWLFQGKIYPNIDSKDPTSKMDRVCVWRGDILTLAVDGIVNAANDGGTGCYQPTHRCIDNMIHRCAGPELRADCHLKMQERKRPLSAGTDPIITGAYCLPSKYVIHTTGPQLQYNTEPSELQETLLSHCYSACLDLAVKHGLKHIAFNCISTGLYGYPGDRACQTACRTVRQWLHDNPGKLELIIFDVFDSKNQGFYESIGKNVFMNKTE